MARTVRNAKIDSRSARAKLAAQKSAYWISISRGFAVGYRKGAKGGMWLAKTVDGAYRRETTIGPADDALDADGEHVLDYAQITSPIINGVGARRSTAWKSPRTRSSGPSSERAKSRP